MRHHRVLVTGLSALVSLLACAPPAPTATAPTTAPPPTTAPAAAVSPATKPAASPSAPPAPSPAVSPAASPSPRPAATSSYTPGPPLNPPVTVRLGSLRNIAESPVAIAEARGYFRAEGISIESTVFNVSADAIPALSNGQIDVMPSSGVSPALFNAAGRGIGLQIIGNGGGVAPGHDWFGISVRNDLLQTGRYRGPADLKGLKVAIPGPYTPVHYMLKVLLEKNGLTQQDIDLQVLGGPDSVVAMSNGSLDALVTVEPFVSLAEQNGAGKRVMGAVDITPGITGGVLLMSPELQRRNPAAAQRFVVAWLRGVRDYLDAFVKGQGQDDAVGIIRKSQINYVPMAQTPSFDPNGRFDASSMRQLLDWYQSEGVISGSVDFDRLVDFNLVDAAARQLGPYS